MGVFKRGPNAFLPIAKHLQETPEESFNVFGKALDYLTRPGSAVAGFAKGLVKGNVGEAFGNIGDALGGDERFEFDDVLKATGLKKGPSIDIPLLGDVSLRGTAGLALDIVLDPLNLVGLFGATTAARKLPKFIAPKTTEAFMKLSNDAASEYGTRKAVAKARAVKQIDDLRGEVIRTTKQVPSGQLDAAGKPIMKRVQKEGMYMYLGKTTKGTPKFQSYKGVLDRPIIPGAGPTKALGKTGEFRKVGAELALAKKLDLPLTKTEDVWAFVDDVEAFEAAKAKVLNRIEDTFNTPRSFEAFKQRFVKRNTAEFDNIKTSLSTAELADEVVRLNAGSIDIIRNVHKRDMGYRGGFLVDAVEKGYASTITIAGKTLPDVAKSLGMPDIVPIKLKQLDVFISKQLSSFGENLRKFPVMKQITEALSMGTGNPHLNFLLSSVRNAAKGNEQAVYETAATIQKSQDTFLKSLEQSTGKVMDDKTKQKFFSQVMNAIESKNPRIAIDSRRATAKKGNLFGANAILPGVYDYADQLSRELDTVFQKHKIAAEDLGLSLSYLKGYFPREMTKEARAFLGRNLEEAGILPKLLPKTNTARVEAFADLSTEQVNRLFRKHGWALQGMNKILKDPKKLKELGVIDPNVVSYFISDPALAIGNNLIRAQKAISNKEMTASLLKTFGNNVFDVNKAPGTFGYGERLLNPANFFTDPAIRKLPEAAQRSWLREVLAMPKMRSQDADRVLAGMRQISWQDSVKMMQDTASSLSAPSTISKTVFKQFALDSPNMMASLYELGIPVYKMDGRVADAIEGMWKIKDSSKTNKAFQYFNQITAMWTRTTLFPFPAHHIRNFLGDLWNNHLAGINPATEWLPGGSYNQARQVLSSMGIFSPTSHNKNKLELLQRITKGVGDIEISGTLGEAFKGNELFQEFIEHGGMSGILRDFNITVDTPMDAIRESLAPYLKGRSKGEIANRLLNPASANFAPVKAGLAAAEMISLENRFAHFIYQRKNGLGADEAMMSMKQFLFDYEHLSDFERNRLKPLFPFYTWTRKNIPLQIQQLAQNPSKFANLMKAVNALEDDEVKSKIPEGGIPEYIKSEFGVPVRMTEDGAVEFQLLGNYVPAADLISAGSPRDMLRTALTSLHPALQALAETGLNRNAFSGQEISAYPGEVGTFLGAPVDKDTINAARKIRILNSTDKMFFGQDPNNPYKKKTFSFSEKTLSAITGLQVNRIDVQKVAERNEKGSSEIASKMRSAYKRAMKLGDTQTLQYLEELMQKGQRK